MPRALTNKASSADNQQETSLSVGDPQRLYAEYPRRKITLQEARLLGILYTDGCLSPKGKNGWRFYLSSTSLEIIQLFQNCMMEVFNLDSRRVKISQREVNGKPFYKAVVSSMEAGNKLSSKYGVFRTQAFKSKNGKLIPTPASLPFARVNDSKLISQFLKVAFSCDGGVNLYVANSRYKFLIRNAYLACHHPRLQSQYKALLDFLGVKSKIIKVDNKILIQGRVNLENFKEKIGFLEGVAITQHSAFWQGWEKNKILELAIASYGNPKLIFNLPQFRKLG